MATIRTNLSSGDLIADRRAAYADMLAESGDWTAAAELMESVLELAPRWTAGWFRLGELRERAGISDASGAYRQALSLDPEDRLGAGLKLALIEQQPVPDAPPPRFVEALFDDYADRFDTSLVEKLQYRVPGLLDAAIRATGIAHFDRAIDLGCGTGLMGVKLRPICHQLVGIDISGEMLRKAEARGCYDALIKADIADTPLEAGADIVAAADVLMYVGALGAIFENVADALKPTGLFAFSVEASDSGDLTLRESRRYAHSEAYLRRVASTAGLNILSLERQVIRMDRDAPIEGLIVVARKV